MLNYGCVAGNLSSAFAKTLIIWFSHLVMMENCAGTLASILAYWQLACVRFESSHAAAAEGGASNQILLSEYFYEEACSVFGINMN